MMMRRKCVLALLAAGAVCLYAQEPAATPANPAAAGSKQRSRSGDAGRKAFATYCAGCHGPAARGGPGAPDLVRSLFVLDDEKGILIAPVIRDGRPDKGMPKPNLTEPQIADIVAWLHVQLMRPAIGGPTLFKDVVTGDPKKGEAYFNGAGRCNTCHSATGDLAGIGRQADPISLQSRWLQPRPRTAARWRAKIRPGHCLTVTVTLPSGETFSGTLDRIDDFTVSLRDSTVNFHSFSRERRHAQSRSSRPASGPYRHAAQIYRRRHPQHDGLPGDTEMNISAASSSAFWLISRSAVLGQGLDPAALLKQLRPLLADL